MFQAMIHGKRSVLNYEARNSPRLPLGSLRRLSNWLQVYLRSTATSKETVEWEDGNEYPLVRVEVTSDSHPFYTGKQKFTQADGAVDKFNKKYGFK